MLTIGSKKLKNMIFLPIYIASVGKNLKGNVVKMGLSANQARFLSLTSRQVDLEFRMQQICQRRLRLADELEKVAEKYNTAISDRKLYAKSSITPYERLSVENLYANDFYVLDGENMINAIGTWKSTGEVLATMPLAGEYGLTNSTIEGTRFEVGADTYRVDSYTDIVDMTIPTYSAPVNPAPTGGATEASVETLNNANYTLELGDIIGTKVEEGTTTVTESATPGIYDCERTNTTTVITEESTPIPEIKQDAPRVVSSASLSSNPAEQVIALYYENFLTSLASEGVDVSGIDIVKYEADKDGDPTRNGETDTIAMRFDSQYSYNMIVNALNTAAPQVDGGAQLTKPIQQKTEVPDGYTAINSVQDLLAIDDNATNLSGNYILMADIDLSSVSLTSKALIDGTFSGNFDGNGYVIEGLDIGSTAQYTGMFSQTNGATIENVSLKNADVSSTAYYTGVLVGKATNTNIDNVYVSGDVQGTHRTGGLVGWTEGCTITNTGTGVTLNSTSSHSQGGLVGYNNNSNISNSYATGSVTTDGGSDYYNGGLIGFNDGTSTVVDSYATGDVTSTDTNTGGLIGYNEATGDIQNSYATGNVSGTLHTGGLIGQNNANASEIYNSHATGNVTGTGENTGGLIGLNEQGNVLTDVYATGAVNGTVDMGGLVGENRSTILGAYASGTVTGNGNDIGGLVGRNGADGYDATITNAYATGDVTNNGTGDATGGLIGYNVSNDILTNVYAENNVTSNGGLTGGLVGHNLSDITNAYHIGTVTADGNHVGGLIGYNGRNGDTSYDSDITNAFHEGDVINNTTGNDNDTGGLIGYNYTKSDLTNVYAIANVTSGGGEVGGLVGENRSIINTAYHTGTVIGGGAQVGGLLGWNNADVTDAYHTAGNVTNTGVNDNYTGGLIGQNDGGNLTRIYAEANVQGDIASSTSASYVGGLIGGNNGDILDAYHTGTVEGNGSYIGGLIGHNGDGDEVTNAYHIGDVTSYDTDGEDTGGLIGWNNGALTNVEVDANVAGHNDVGVLVGDNNNDPITNYNITGTASDYWGTGNGKVNTVIGVPDSTTLTGAGLANVTFSSADVAQPTSAGASVDDFNFGAFFFETDLEFVLDDDINIEAGAAILKDGSNMHIDTYSRPNTTGVTGWDNVIDTNPIVQEYVPATYSKVVTETTYTWQEASTAEYNEKIREFSAVKVEQVEESIDVDDLETGLRSGRYNIATIADENTQNPVKAESQMFEVHDWRTEAIIFDDLYEGNDTEAIAEYEFAVQRINNSEKKLQLEQTNIETEHRAVITQKDAVKTLINKNIEFSFKTFS